LVTKPSLGEIIAVAEPDCNLLISPTESADILNNLLPSPSTKDAEIVFVTNTEPVTSVSTFIESLSSVIVALESPSAILLISPTNADVGILVIEFPSPSKDPLNEPLNSVPLIIVPSIVPTTIPSAVSVDVTTSLPLNTEPVYETAEIPLSTDNSVLIITESVDTVICSTPFTSKDSKL